MSEYALTLTGVCMLSSAVGILLSESGFEKCAEAVMGIILLYAILSPIPALVREVDYDFEGYPQIEYNDAFADTLESGTAEGIRLALCEKFDLRSDEVEVATEIAGADPLSFEKITVVLKGAAALSDYRRIREFVENMELGRCEVRIEYG